MTGHPEGNYHYGVMRRAIGVIDQAQTPLSLEELAAQMQMSPAHFQRVFSQWVGVSPKRYQQYLMLGHAKRLLSERLTTLETSQELGLSGSGRLHDLFLRWEAMSPGAYARSGAGLLVRWGWFDSPFGPALVMGTERGICGIGLADEIGADATMADLRSRWPEARYVEDDATLRPWVERAFYRFAPHGGATLGQAAPLHLLGAPFQIKVWEALLQVPQGQVTSYSHLAKAIGHPGAVRAVGSAVGRNPIGLLIPCHRVLRKSGQLGGYHWGLPMKRAILAWEAARADG